VTFDPIELVKAIVSSSAGAAAATGAFVLWQARVNAGGATAKAKIEAPADMLVAMGAFQKALNEQSQALTEDLRKELRLQARRIDVLEQENEACRRDNEQLRGDVANMRQWASSLEELLRRNNIPIAARDMPGSFLVLEGDRSTVMKPQEGEA
jgi:predicted ribosome quality control (RQC) complex YloA/Tae2 family protein